MRNAALRSHKNHRMPGSWGRAAIRSFLYCPGKYGTSRTLNRGTLGAFVAGAIHRGNTVEITSAGHNGDITKRRARQYFAVDAFARCVFAVTPVNVIAGQIPLGTDRPRQFDVGRGLRGCRNNRSFKATGRGGRKDVTRRDHGRHGVSRIPPNPRRTAPRFEPYRDTFFQIQNANR